MPYTAVNSLKFSGILLRLYHRLTWIRNRFTYMFRSITIFMRMQITMRGLFTSDTRNTQTKLFHKIATTTEVNVINASKVENAESENTFTKFLSEWSNRTNKKIAVGLQNVRNSKWNLRIIGKVNAIIIPIGNKHEVNLISLNNVCYSFSNQ